MPRVINGIVLAKQRESIKAGTPKGSVFVESGYDNETRITQVRNVRIKFVIIYFGPPHPTTSCPIDETSMDFTERFLDMVVETGRNTNTCRPELNMAQNIVRIVCVANVEPNKVIEFETLIDNIDLYHEIRIVMVATYLESTVGPWGIFDLHPRE